ncbi:MAG: allantoicase [Vicinamibacteraceae bacterium]
MTDTASSAAFTGLIDLAAIGVGGTVLGTSDDFFASANNLIEPGRGVFVEGKFTDRGKWMDGWESRRKRGPGYDWCVLELGAPGTVVGFDVDTHYFVGNSPAFVSIDGLHAPRGTTLAALQALQWTELLPQMPVRPDAQNLFAASPPAATPGGSITHVRLNIFPDGGVARFRVFGRVAAEWTPPALDRETRSHAIEGSVDLAAVANGGLALACSDAFFGPMNNLLLPGRAENMGGGWETRRKRAAAHGAAHDWILVRLGARGTINTIEIDTNHFKGNYPDRCSLQGIDASGARITDLITSQAWLPLLAEVKLNADERRFFTTDVAAHGPVSHVRLNIHPDGGVSRLRLWGTLAAEPHAVLNALSIDDARAALLRCCGATRWAGWLLTQRPFASTEALLKAAAGVWTQMEKADMLEAFSHHPEIGSDIASLRQRFASTAAWASAEQAGVAGADDATLEALRDGNARYRQKFGYVFLVCATGKTAAEMLARLQARLPHDADSELQVAAVEQAKITRLRLEKLSS